MKKLIWIGDYSLWAIYWNLETRGKVWNKEELPVEEEDQVREHLNWTYL